MLERMSFLSAFDWVNCLLAIAGLIVGLCVGYRLSERVGAREAEQDSQAMIELEEELFVLRNRIYEQEQKGTSCE